MPMTNLFMELIADGGSKVSGESEVDGYAGLIELDDWSWSLHWEAASGDERAGIAPTTFTFAKGPDRSSTVMMKALVSGKPFTKAIVHFVDFLHTRFELHVEFTEFRIVSYSLSGSIGNAEASMSETWEADFNQIKLKHAHHTHSKQKIHKESSIERPRHKVARSGARDTPEAKYKQWLKEQDALEKKAGAKDDGKGKGKQ